jgi:hypothetical protein
MAWKSLSIQGSVKSSAGLGKADGVDRVLDGKVWGDPTYANDWLVMKWSKEFQ